MARILLLDSNEQRAQALAAFLMSARHSVTVCAAKLRGLHELESAEVPFDIVILDLTENGNEDWHALDLIRRAEGLAMAAPMILCISSAYRGAQFRLRVERRGARLAYVRNLCACGGRN